MKKAKILGIIAIAVIGALLIYNHFDKNKKVDNNYNKFSTEYLLVDKNNIYKYSSIDEVIRTLNEGTGIIFLCTPDSEWCQMYALYLNDELIKNNINEIKYLNIKNYRELNTSKYQKIVDLLENYIYKDDTGERKIFMPDVTFVKNGKIIFHDNETSLVASDQEPMEYWTEQKILELKNKFREAIIKLNSDIIEEDITEISDIKGVE